MIIGYVRVSTNKQDNENQLREIEKFCKSYKPTIQINEYIIVEQSSRKSQEKRRISELKNKLQKDDVLIVTELSRLGRSMFEVIQLVMFLMEKEIKILYTRQQELNNIGEMTTKLLLAFYAYLAEIERDIISKRTKAGLEKARQSGKKLGRPFGAKSGLCATAHFDIFHKDKDKIIELRKKGLPRKSIYIYLYGKFDKKNYNRLLYFCKKMNIQ